MKGEYGEKLHGIEDLAGRWTKTIDYGNPHMAKNNRMAIVFAEAIYFKLSLRTPVSY